MIVLDASLAAKLVIDEADSTVAESWFGTVAGEIVAPELIMIEVAQAIDRRVNMRNLGPARGRTALQA